ncbi:sugar transferase [Mycolicibacterium sp. F2034L]|uniref:sugar transferase n=1 Tax=Mycolicibacterium sp. F2034L TaxID=2926422 RepID=UPI001FF6CCBE|nr:sugar transferase [Mycolicibacterium sp. F2034L]MCK0176872.1 sugar transferase [Mycolicibacterium sp. F2034L]
MVAVDAVILLVAGTVADLITRFADGTAGPFSPRDLLPWCALAAAWMLALSVVRSRDMSLAGIGAEEYRRVLTASGVVLGIAALTDVMLMTTVSRLHLGLAFVLGVAGLLTGRHLLRTDLRRRRRRGDYVTRVVVLGSADSAQLISQSFARQPDAGYEVVGLCVPGFTGEFGDEVLTPTGVVPVIGDDTVVKAALRYTGADALAVAAAEQLGHENMRTLAWRMESMHIELLVVPGVTDVAGHRLRMLPVDNLPLFRIDAPPLHDGSSMHAKRALDLILGTAGLIVAAPVIALAALAVRLDDGGPPFFRQQRVGLGGRSFWMVKLRTMKPTPDAPAAPGRGGAVFNGKAGDDARITRVGKFLRATSLDELPQLLNVVGGSMSLVGPRPLVVGEAESVEHFLARRALVKPGMTGLWQVSGRSDVADSERVRLDHSYVDNWSVAADLMIIWRTVRAVLKRDGAY